MMIHDAEDDYGEDDDVDEDDEADHRFFLFYYFRTDFCT